MEDEAGEIVSATLRTYPYEVAVMVGRNFIAALQTHRPAHEFIAWTPRYPP